MLSPPDQGCLFNTSMAQTFGKLACPVRGPKTMKLGFTVLLCLSVVATDPVLLPGQPCLQVVHLLLLIQERHYLQAAQGRFASSTQ
jgi:hypothetical protein